jgi:hypothetical protein
MAQKKTRQEENNERIDALIGSIRQIVEQLQKAKVRTERDGWFANSELNHVRTLSEQRGHRVASLFLADKMATADNRFERLRQEALRDVFEAVVDSGLDRLTGSYIVGKLNAILAHGPGAHPEKEKDHEQRGTNVSRRPHDSRTVPHRRSAERPQRN